MSHFYDNRVNIYPSDSVRESINPPVVSKEDINYENDSSYMKRLIRKKISKRATKLGIIFGLIIGIAVTAACIILHRNAIKNELAEEIAKYNSAALMKSPANKRSAYLAQANGHDVLIDLLDDGDCTTAVICPCCDTVLVAAKEHTPEADDGNCLTERLCTECGKVALEAHTEHTPEADDGDCTTPIKCAYCDIITTKAKKHIDDDNCTTDSVCKNEGCNHVIPAQHTEHTAEEDDHNCLTAQKCLYCSYVFVEANANHITADDGDCTTALICSSCNTVVKEAHTAHLDDGDCTTTAKCQRGGCEITVSALSLAHLPEEDDGNCTTDILCKTCGKVAEIGRSEHIAHDDGDCTTSVKCSLCNTVTIPARVHHSPEADDGDCTTPICCLICNKVTTPANASHIPGADDGDCTTPIRCSACDTVTTPAYESHVPMADDNDCTTAVVCSVCQTVTTPAHAKHTPEADDEFLTTDILCEICGATVIFAPIDKTEYLNAILYILAIGIAAALAVILIFKLVGAISGAAKAKNYEKNKKIYDSYNLKHFENVRNNLLENRKNLVCESAASVRCERQGLSTQECNGRIFLTEQALEFYDIDLTSAYKNFVIPLNSIQLAEADTSERGNEFSLHTNYGKFYFTVPDASAGIWKKQIDTACELKRFNATSK